MSLVNDALKRAKQVQKNGPPPLARGPAPLHAQPPGPVNPLVRLLWPVAVGACLAVLTGVIWLVSRQSADSSATMVVRAKTATVPDRESASTTRPSSSPAGALAVAKTVTEASPSDASANVSPPANRSTSPVLPPAPAAGPESGGRALESATSSVPAVVVAGGPPAPPPLPRLQGIFYRADRPTAVLDGRTVYVGKSVGDCLVVGITRQQVKVVRAGQTNVLEMPD
jgi:hypothetical protein